MGRTYQIAEVAQRSGFPASTLRYWDQIGLLSPSGRSGAGYRLYDDEALERLTFIAATKQVGATLEEIADLLGVRDAGRCGPVQDRLRALLATKLRQAQRQMEDLAVLTAELERVETHLAGPAPNGPCGASCGCTPIPADPGTTGTTGATAFAPSSTVRDSRALDGACCAGSALGVAHEAGLSPTSAGVAAERPPGGPGGAPDDLAHPLEDVAAACTLAPSDMASRLDEWHGLLALVATRERLDGGVRLTFAPDTSLAEVAPLVEAERRCCSFFSFAMTIDERGAALEVRAPDHAADALGVLLGEVP